MRKYDDLVVGETFASDLLTVDKDEMLGFSRQFDPQWFHTDEAEAQNSPFGEVIASGVYVLALWRRLDHTICGDIDYICGVEWNNVQWRIAVKAGMQLRATSKLLDKRLSGSGKKRGIATYLCGLEDADGNTVLQFESIALVNV
ncbi:MAG: MaoC/PaaZ C-terminal domain-containing protein [Parvibaculales bacterium]